MDIENVHPFCLPFSLCHDATSSSCDVLANGGAEQQAQQQQQQQQQHATANEIHNESDKEANHHRAKANSPIDDLFCSMSADLSPSEQSFLTDDSVLGPSSSSAADLSTFYSSVRLDLESEISHQDYLMDDVGLHPIDRNHDDENSLDSSKLDDWAHHYNTLLQSDLEYHHQAKRSKSLLRSTFLSGHNQNVFHQIDILDTKSSPTLAQLNLNSNDDPTDGLWDTPATASAASLMVHKSAGSSDLLSNCTNVSTTPAHHHHHHFNRAQYHQNLNQHQMAAGHSLPQCHCYHSHQVHGRCLSSPVQSTCLAVAPFRKTTDQLHSAAYHQQQYSCRQKDQADGELCVNHSNVRSELLVAKQQHECCSNVELHKQSCQQHRMAHKMMSSQRCASPALVTSSSSPFSSSAAASPAGAHGGENKLKENIEYLTALICNGSNKIASSPQSISSTMFKSYSTLAQSLATEPKLFERSQSNNTRNPTAGDMTNAGGRRHLAPEHQPETHSHCPSKAPLRCGGGGGDDPNLDPTQRQLAFDDDKQAANKQPTCAPDQRVESSVSAADSTAENQTSDNLSQQLRSNGANLVCSHSNLSHHHPTTMLDHDKDHAQARESEPRVLSSLLNSIKYPTNQPTCPNAIPTFGAPSMPRSDCYRYPPLGQSSIVTRPQALATPISISTNIQAQSQQSQLTINQNQQQQQQQEPASIPPPNGKPITLMPVMASNGVVIQQQQQQQHQRKPFNRQSNAPLFAQPTSPSSSTASSNSTVDSYGANCNKKQRLSAHRTPVHGAAGDNQNPRFNPISTDCSLSSHDEGFSSQVENVDCASNRDSEDDDDDDIDSDDESFYGDYTNSDLIGATISDNADCKWTLNMGRTRRNGQKRFFWQYNVQSKGPKGSRISSTDGSDDPFNLPEASDPVFSNDCQIEGVKHSGKARRGDGNDLTPNPRKLLMIGLELKKLSKVINDLAPVTELPLNARNKNRKEKNKLASRACRLKKKAQHEANKIKLYGLQLEHKQVVVAICDVRKYLRESLEINDSNEPRSFQNHPSSRVGQIVSERCSMEVAGQSSDYVNSVLEKVVSGCIDGGLQT